MRIPLRSKRQPFATQADGNSRSVSRTEEDTLELEEEIPATPVNRKDQVGLRWGVSSRCAKALLMQLQSVIPALHWSETEVS